MNNLAPMKSVLECKVDQISSQTISVSVEILYERLVSQELVGIFPDDISTPHTET